MISSCRACSQGAERSNKQTLPGKMLWKIACSVDAFRLTGPFPFAQHVLLDLPGRGFRQRTEFIDFRYFERAQLRARKLFERAGVDRIAGLQRDERFRYLAPLLVRNC